MTDSTTDLPQSVGAAFLATAEAHPDLLAIVTGEAMLTFSQLATMVRGFASRLSQSGVGQGSVVAVDSDNLIVSMPVMLATSLLGAGWIARSRLPDPADLTVTHFVAGVGEPSAGDPGVILVDDSWLRQETLEEVALPGPLARADWLHFSTSGTTGTPKIVALSQEIMQARLAALSGDFVTRQTVFCGLFPCFAPPYVTFTLACMVHGCTIVRSREPGLWRDAGVNLVHGSVSQAKGLLDSVSFDGRFPMIHVGGARLPEALAQALLARFDRVIEIFASTETNRSFKNEKTLGPGGEILSRGLPQDSEVQIVTEAGEPCPPGEAGLVRVRNPYLAQGYLNNPEATARSFRDGWFYPGDFGQFGPNGELVILGRSGDVVNLGGIKVNVAEVDRVLASVDGIAEAVAFEDVQADRPSRIAAFVVLDPGADLDTVAQTAAATFAERLPQKYAPSRIVPIDSIPRASDGGIQRFRCKQIFEEMKRTIAVESD